MALFEKAAAIAISLGQIGTEYSFRPEYILRTASAEEIDFYYEKICK